MSKIDDIKLFNFQVEPKDQIRETVANGQSKLLVSPTGTGKTVMIDYALAEIQKDGKLLPNDECAWPILSIGPKATLIQEKRWRDRLGLQGTFVCSYSQLRSERVGQFFIDWQTRMKYGEPELVPVWKGEALPKLIIAQECQMVKNSSSLAAKVIDAARKQGVPIIYSSATPFARISESEIVCKGLGIASDNSWPSFARSICAYGKSPNDRSPKNAENLNAELEAHNALIRPKNIRFPHKLIKRHNLLDPSSEQKSIIDHAYTQYLEVKAKQGRTWTPQGVAALWAAWLKMREACELVRVDTVCEMILAELAKGRQPIVGTSFRAVLAAIHNKLQSTYNVKDHRIAIIVGGQSDKERQGNMDEFNRCDRPIMLFTLRSGGTGIDLPHSADNPRACPRSLILPTTWSPFDYLQAVGRPHRINSISDTTVDTLWYNNTIEERVYSVMAPGLESLATFLTRANSIIDVFNQESDKDLDEKLVEQLIDEGTAFDDEGNAEFFAAEAYS